MKAYVLSRYGPPEVLELREQERPSPKPGEVLVKVHATSINDWEWELMHGKPFVNRLIYGLREPKVQVLGCDVSGRVEAVGEGVKTLRPGDEVFGDLSLTGFGAFAEYVCAPEAALRPKPAGLSFEEAAALPHAGCLAMQGLHDRGEMQSGQHLLINGAGGGVGTIAIQLAKLQGCEVTGVDRSDKLEGLLSLGFDHVIDYTSEDFTLGDRRYDLILDVKTNRPAADYARALRPDGIYVTVGGSMGRLAEVLLLGPWFSLARKKSVRILALKQNLGLEKLSELCEAGKLKPVIDRIYPFHELPAALRRFGRADQLGKIVVRMQE